VCVADNFHGLNPPFSAPLLPVPRVILQSEVFDTRLVPLRRYEVMESDISCSSSHLLSHPYFQRCTSSTLLTPWATSAFLAASTSSPFATVFFRRWLGSRTNSTSCSFPFDQPYPLYSASSRVSVYSLARPLSPLFALFFGLFLALFLAFRRRPPPGASEHAPPADVTYSDTLLTVHPHKHIPIPAQSPCWQRPFFKRSFLTTCLTAPPDDKGSIKLSVLRLRAPCSNHAF